MKSEKIFLGVVLVFVIFFLSSLVNRQTTDVRDKVNHAKHDHKMALRGDGASAETRLVSLEKNVANLQHTLDSVVKQHSLMLSHLDDVVRIVGKNVGMNHTAHSIENIEAYSMRPFKKDGKIRSFTFSNTYFTFLCDLLVTAMQSGVEFELLGWGKPYKGLGSKISGMLEAVKTMEYDSDVVLFTDAHDVLITDSIDVIKERFYHSGAEILFMGEKGCWPFMDGRKGGEHICQNVYPPSPTPYRYLNSGVWMAYAGAARELLHMLSNISDEENDQEVVSNLYIKQDMEIKLDHKCEIFQSVHLSWQDLQFDGTGYRNKVTNTKPAIFHFNGGGKQWQPEFTRKVIGARPLPDNVKERPVKGSNAKMADVCCSPAVTDKTKFNKVPPQWCDQ